MDYQEFIRSKQRDVKPFGFDVELSAINGSLFEWQKRAVQWSIKRGRSAMFEECGLGKTRSSI